MPWQRGSTGVERYGCIPRSAANNLGEIPRKMGALNPLFYRGFLGRERFGTRPFQSPSLSGIRLCFVPPHFPPPPPKCQADWRANQYCFGRGNSLSSAPKSLSSVRNSVSSLWHTKNWPRGTHWALSPELGEAKKLTELGVLKPYHWRQNDYHYLHNFYSKWIVLGNFVCFLCLRERNSGGIFIELPSKNYLT